MRLDGKWRISSFGINHTAPFSGGKAAICKTFLMLSGALLWKSALTRQPTIFLHFEMESNLQVNVHLWVWIVFFFFFFSSTDNKGRWTVSTELQHLEVILLRKKCILWPRVKAERDDMKLIWVESAKLRIDLLFYSSATEQPVVFILKFPRQNASAVIFHQDQISGAKPLVQSRKFSILWCLWSLLFDSPPLLVQTTDEATVQSLFWS